jgi:hypothetical protein
MHVTVSPLVRTSSYERLEVLRTLRFSGIGYVPGSDLGPETGHFDGGVSNWSVISAGPPAVVIEKSQPRKFLFAVIFSVVCIGTVRATDSFII